MTRRSVGILAVLLAVLTACDPASTTSIAAQGLQRGPDGWHGLPLEVERSLPDVTLLDTEDEPFPLVDELTGTPTLLFFGYTSCPDICPVHLAAIASAMESSGTSYLDVDVVFVSVDPERDTPERIDDYLANFSARMIGLHEDLDVVGEALAALDLPGPIVEGPDPRGEGDLIGHPAQVIVFDADGEARRTYPFGARRSDWIGDLPRIVEEYS
ncbi:MAG: SCO family protein [Nitriliruptoraceae bacterium]|nr:SCO family protein [Nitriliruptoraceae bacterium]